MIKQPSNANRPKAVNSGLVVQELENETLIYSLESHKATCLNAFSARVWRLCDGTRTVDDVTQELGLDDSGADTVALTLKKLARADLVTGFTGNAPPSGHTRRAVIHGALAVTAAIPIVTTMTIPTAVQATSGCGGEGARCGTGYAPCCNGLICRGRFTRRCRRPGDD